MQRNRFQQIAILSMAAAVVVTTGCEVSKRSEVCVPANNDKVVSIIGYVSVGGFSIISDNDFPVKLVESMQSEDEITVYVDLGNGPNTMKPLPNGDFTNEDIQLNLADGGTKGWGSRVKVTGRLTVNEHTCAIYDVDKLEAP
jgi:hypothetical protein